MTEVLSNGQKMPGAYPRHEQDPIQETSLVPTVSPDRGLNSQATLEEDTRLEGFQPSIGQQSSVDSSQNQDMNDLTHVNVHTFPQEPDWPTGPRFSPRDVLNQDTGSRTLAPPPAQEEGDYFHPHHEEMLRLRYHEERARRRVARRRNRNEEPGTPKSVASVNSQPPSIAETMQLMIMSQMMSQQMAGQQLQSAQMMSMQQGGKHQSHACREGCSKGSGGRTTAIQVQNCQNSKKGKKRPAVARRRISRSMPGLPVVRADPLPMVPFGIDEGAFDNWQEITVILVIAIIGLIYLVCSRPTAPGNVKEEKKENPAVKHLS